MPQVKEDAVYADINLNDLSVNRNEVIQLLGYSDGGSPNNSVLPDAQIIEMIDEVIGGLAGRCEIKAGYRTLKVSKPENRNDGLIIGETFFGLQKIVASHLRKSEKAALFVCTIGPGMEDWGRQLLFKGEPLLCYIADTAASIVVEKASDFLHDFIKNKMDENGLKITNRYSPGYCGWAVSEQKQLFSLLPEKFCGITLNESALMLPVKSISGIIGIGAQVKWKEYSCDNCGIKDCTYRVKRNSNKQRKALSKN